MAKQKEMCPVTKNCTIGINDSHLQKEFCCHKCLKDIVKGERFVLAGTYVLNSTYKPKLKPRVVCSANVGLVEEKAFHTTCWREMLEQMVSTRLKTAQEQAVNMLNSNPLFAQIKNMLPRTIPLVEN